MANCLLTPIPDHFASKEILFFKNSGLVLELGLDSSYDSRTGSGVKPGSCSGSKNQATVNQHPPVHHQGWMICDQETVFC
jgi:hypothetical protein